MATKTHSGTPPKLRTPNEVADSAIERFARATSDGASVDSDAWKRAISAEARAFAMELTEAAVETVIGRARGKRSGKKEAAQIASEIYEKLAGAAG